MSDLSAETVVRRFVDAFDPADLNAMADCLAEDLIAEVTQPDGSTSVLHGRDAYMASIDALDMPTVRPSIQPTQIATVSNDKIMVMVEIKASRKGLTLHNFAAFLIAVVDGRIARIWMVEALPEECDRFWKA